MAVQSRQSANETTQSTFETELYNFQTAFKTGTLDDKKIGSFVDALNMKRASASRAELRALKDDVVLPLFIQTNRAVQVKRNEHDRALSAGSTPAADPQFGYLIELQDRIRTVKGELNAQISHGPAESTISRWFAQQAKIVSEKVAKHIPHLRLVQSDSDKGKDTPPQQTKSAETTSKPTPQLTVVQVNATAPSVEAVDQNTQAQKPRKSQEGPAEKADAETSLKIASTIFMPEEKVRERQSHLMRIRLRAMEAALDALSGKELAAYKLREVGRRLEEAKQEIRNRYKPAEYQGTTEQKRAAFFEKEKDLVAYAKNIAVIAQRINEKLADPQQQVEKHQPVVKKENTIVRLFGSAMAYLKPQRQPEKETAKAVSEEAYGKNILDRRWTPEALAMREKTIHAQLRILTGDRLASYKENVLAPLFKRAGAELKVRANAIEVNGSESRWSAALKTEKPLVDFVLALHREYKAANEKIAANPSSSSTKPNTIERAMNRDLA